CRFGALSPVFHWTLPFGQTLPAWQDAPRRQRTTIEHDAPATPAPKSRAGGSGDLTALSSCGRVRRRPHRAKPQEDVAVSFRTRTMLAVAMGLSLAQALFAQQPNAINLAAPQQNLSPNQQIADNIADSLRQSGQLRNYRIDVTVDAGTALLTGTVEDQPQREEALRIVQGIPGVERVLDRLTTGATITQVQAGPPPPPPARARPPGRPGPPPAPPPPLPAAAPAAFGRNPAADAALRLADLRAVQQLLAGSLP